MKKVIISILLLIPSAIFAEEDDVKIGNLWYNLIDKAKVAEVTDWDRYVSDIIIPSNVDYNGKTYKVERIREEAFYIANNKHGYREKGKKNLKSVQIPEGVIEICKRAFVNDELESVNIPNSVTTIGESAFSSCGKLSSPIVLTNVERIENGTFWSCSSLSSIKMSEKVTYIGRDAFYECKSLQSITIPNSVVTIDVDAFMRCSSLKSLHIPASVIDIDLNSFGNAFQGCESLESITVDPNNPVYDSRNNCNAIVDKRLNRLVAGCQNTTIPSGIWEIGQDAFFGCTHLKNIDIPSSVYWIGTRAFEGCTELSYVTFHGDTMTWGSSVFQGCKSLKAIDIPEGVNDLYYSFEGCSSLERVSLPQTVTSLSFTFKDCTNLTEFNIPERIDDYSYSFDNCKKIKSALLPYGCYGYNIGFNGCNNLETISLPSSIKHFSNSFRNCKSLLDVFCYATNPPSCNQCFTGSDIKYSTLHVPEQSVEEYSKANVWKDFGKIVGVKIPEISKEDAMSKLNILKDLCKIDNDAIRKEAEDYKDNIPYSNLNTFTSYWGSFMHEIDGAIQDIKNNDYRADYKPDYYQIEHLEKLWNETYHPQTSIVIARIKDMLSNLVTLTYKCNFGGKIRICSTWNGGIEISNETKQVQFVNPELRMENGCRGFYVFALPDDGYHVESFKVGGVEQLGNSEYIEEQIIYGTVRYNSLRFSYHDVEVVFAAGETGIRSIRVDGKSNSVYSINGIKVRENTTSLEGLPKGIYIVNGKKVVIK